ncbi:MULTISPECIES: MarR family winged helix-turn-helix transcriptional regulator [Paenibacillus]|uniref:MarR family winged helix-turn-helix transcriptional regulator n=1 Tax=Paenibacillus TaxID=44249 RepID=UPI0022B8F1A9|nr:MarR family transcriptional regulator [Paenibacillus caseinilyticus]MCZ8523344.1 MarR family transcriptional regulator [Paenibacillus caseinilyticus]
MDQNRNLLQLDNQLCFAIYATSREITKLYQPFLDQIGLTYPQYLAMLVLWERLECSVKELGEALYLDSGTLTPLLKRLEASGLVTRRRSAEDERVVKIGLTEQGQALQEKAAIVPQALQQQTCLSAAELEGLLKQFKTLLQRVHEAGGRTGGADRK